MMSKRFPSYSLLTTEYLGHDYQIKHCTQKIGMKHHHFNHLTTLLSKGGLVWLFSANPSQMWSWRELIPFERSSKRPKSSSYYSYSCKLLAASEWHWSLRKRNVKWCFWVEHRRQCEMCFTCNILAPNFEMSCSQAVARYSSARY